MTYRIRVIVTTAYIHLHLCLSDVEAAESTARKSAEARIVSQQTHASIQTCCSLCTRFCGARLAHLLRVLGHLRSWRISKNLAIPLVFYATTRNSTCLVGFWADLLIRCAQNRKMFNSRTFASVRPLFLGYNVGIYATYKAGGFISNQNKVYGNRSLKIRILGFSSDAARCDPLSTSGCLRGHAPSGLVVDRQPPPCRVPSSKKL